MRIIAVTNRKGGVGKTTIATHLAAGLVIRGKNVLLVDTDPQGHAGMCLGVKKEGGLFKLLVDNATFEEVLRPVAASAIAVPDEPPAGNLFVLPSDEKTQVIPMLEKNPFAFANRLDDVDAHFDYCVIDTAPTATMFDGAVYLAAEGFVYVTECEKLSFDGLANGIKQVKEFAPQRRNYQLPEAKILGIIPNMMRPNTENHTANLEALRKNFGDVVWEAIPQRTIISESTNYGKVVFAYAPNSREAGMMNKVVEQFEKVTQEWQNA